MWGKRYSHIPYQLLRDNQKQTRRWQITVAWEKTDVYFSTMSMSTVSGRHAALLQEFIMGFGYTQLNCSSPKKILSCVEWKMDPCCFTTFWQNGAERGKSWDWRFPPSPCPGLSSLGRRAEGRVRQERTSDWWQLLAVLRHLYIDQR